MQSKQISVEQNINEGLLQSYEAFAPAVENLRAELQKYNVAGKDRANHPGWLGKGQSAEVYVITVEGKQYACRFGDIYQHQQDLYWPFHSKIKTSFGSHILGLSLMLNVPGFARAQAASSAERITITDIAPGWPLRKWLNDYQQMPQFKITDAQINRLFDALEQARTKDIFLDINDGNIFYDPLEGFCFVDYGAYTPEVYKIKETFENLLYRVWHLIISPPIPEAYPILCPIFGDFLARSAELSAARYGSRLDGIWRELARKNDMRRGNSCYYP